MKRLKYRCLFGGKIYPYYAVIGAFIFGMTRVISKPTTTRTVLFLIGLPLLALVVCFFFEHRLTDGEMQIMSESSYPLWNPVPEELKALLKQQYASPSPILIVVCILAVLIVMPVTYLVSGGENIPLQPLVITAAIVGFAFIIDFLRRAAWTHIDDSAVFALIPIDHMYDVEHRNKNNSFFRSYMVFYLPDGRYVLPVAQGDGDTDTLAVFKSHGFITWLPFRE